MSFFVCVCVCVFYNVIAILYVFHHLVDSRPTKKKLLELIPHVAPQWYELGIQLLNEDQEPHLDIIKADHGNNHVKSCTEMFWYWLKTHPKASWQQLINSLKSPAIQLHTVAANIEGMFTG